MIAALAHIWSCADLVRRPTAITGHASARRGRRGTPRTGRHVDYVATGMHLIARKEKGSKLARCEDMRSERFGACSALCEVGLSADGRVR